MKTSRNCNGTTTLLNNKLRISNYAISPDIQYLMKRGLSNSSLGVVTNRSSTTDISKINPIRQSRLPAATIVKRIKQNQDLL